MRFICRLSREFVSGEADEPARRVKGPGGGRCKPSMGAFQNASMHFETPATALHAPRRLISARAFFVAFFVRALGEAFLR